MHAYLETIGVINVGHQLAPPPARPYNPPSATKPAKPAKPARDALGPKGKIAKEKVKESKEKEKQRTAPEAGPQDKEKVALQASRDKEEHDQEEALRRRFSNVLPVTS